MRLYVIQLLVLTAVMCIVALRPGHAAIYTDDVVLPTTPLVVASGTSSSPLTIDFGTAFSEIASAEIIIDFSAPGFEQNYWFV